METFPSLSNFYLEPGIASYSEKSLYIQTFVFVYYTVFLIAAETALALIMASVYYNLGSVYF